MAEQATKVPRRRRRDRPTVDGVDVGPAPVEVHPSIVSLRGAHRAAHPDTGTILEAASHLLMANEWPINCPRFMSGLQAVGMDCVSRLQYIKLDHHLLTALVERWSPQTNSFHFPVGEMTVTLEDVRMILGLEVDGPPLIGRIVIGEGKRWLTWPDCCDDLLGHHPAENVEYHDPVDHRKTSTFRMGQAHAKTCMPLRWLRWSFYRDSYIDLSEVDFTRHIQAYILFMLGCFLLPDTSESEVHLQYLPLLEDLELFATHSIGGAVLAHLYRELNEATKPRRVNMAGCLHLLQIWSWEHLHVGRPMLHVPIMKLPYGSTCTGIGHGHHCTCLVHPLTLQILTTHELLGREHYVSISWPARSFFSHFMVEMRTPLFNIQSINLKSFVAIYDVKCISVTLCFRM